MNSPIDEFEILMLDYVKGNLSSEDLQRLIGLLKSDPSCRKMYQQFSRAYGLASTPWFEGRRVQNWKQLHDKLNIPYRKEQLLNKQIWIWRAASIVLLLVSFSIAFYHYTHLAVEKPASTALCILESPIGTQSRLTLPDSTVVCLNGSSILKYDASAITQGQQRTVYLIGEAYFEVSRNPHKPFIVHAEGLNIKVLGTTFNVNAYSEENDIKVSLIEGQVDVYADFKDYYKVTLAPNEQAVFNKKNGQISVRAVDALAQSTWVTGRFIFANETLYHILEIIAEKHNIRMQVHSRKVFFEYFSGSIDVNLGLDEILSYIDVDNKFKWSIKGNILTITDKNP